MRRRTLEGEVTGADMQDWPLTFEDLEPYYEEVEEVLQIAGPTSYPWGKVAVASETRPVVLIWRGAAIERCGLCRC